VHNTTNRDGDNHRLISDRGVDLHEIVENIHVGFANFSDLKMHFDDWESAAKFYATVTSQQFKANKEQATCELCGVAEDTKSHQLLFRVFLDRVWDREVTTVLGVLLALALPIIILFQIGRAHV